MNIRTATFADCSILSAWDRHIAATELEHLISMERVLILEIDGTFAGWLRWNLFWDNTPFLNLLFLLEPFRGHGFGKAMMEHWESAMRNAGFDTVITSTASDEYAQHFYQKLNYTAIGGFTPFGDPYELLLAKKL